jgi:hypothetical protein
LTIDRVLYVSDSHQSNSYLNFVDLFQYMIVVYTAHRGRA